MSPSADPQLSPDQRIFWRVAVIIGVASYLGALYWAEAHLIGPVFGNRGYVVAPIPDNNPWVLFGLALLPAFWLPLGIERVSSFVLWLLYLVVVCTGILVPFWTGTLHGPRVLQFSFFLLISLGLASLMTALPTIQLPRLAIGNSLFWSLVLLAIVLIWAGTVALFGFPERLPSVYEVYQVRGEFKAEVQLRGAGILWGIVWVGNVLAPMTMAFAVRRRRPLLWAGVLAIQLTLFAIAGLKTMLFAPILIAGLIVLLAWRKVPFALVLVAASLFSVAACIAVDLFVGRPLLDMLLVRRVLILPGLLSGYYVEFFSNHPHAQIGYSFLGRLTDDAYGRTAGYVIGDLLAPGAGSNANANLFAAAYSKFGWGGIPVFGVLLGAVLWLADQATRGKDRMIALAIFAMPAVAVTNSELLTTLLGHGLGLGLVLAWLWPDPSSRGSIPSSSQGNPPTEALPLSSRFRMKA